jgi:hypothetical protein
LANQGADLGGVLRIVFLRAVVLDLLEALRDEQQHAHDAIA